MSKLLCSRNPKAISVLIAMVCAGVVFPSGCGVFERSKTISGHSQVRTVAGKGREFGEPFGLAIKNDELYVSDGDAGKIFKIDKNGGISIFAEGFHTPSAIAFTTNGGLIVADTGSHTVRKIDPSGTIRIIAGVDGKQGFSDREASSAVFNGPIGIAVADDNRIFVADTYNDRIRVIENGIVRTVAGGERGFADGIGSEARFDAPLGIAIWRDKLLVADSGNRRIRVVEPDGRVWTLAGSGEQILVDGSPAESSFDSPTAVTANDAGIIYIADGNTIRVIGRRAFPFVETISDMPLGFRDGRTARARFNRPSGLVLDEGGDLFVADSDNQVVRVFTDAPAAAKIGANEISSLRYSANEFKTLQSARWPFDPPEAPRDIAGTLGELRGEVNEKGEPVRFHNGLDIAGSYGETTRFIRSEPVLHPHAAENLGTSRELLRMPTIGYIHLRIGRYEDDKLFADSRFQFETDDKGKPVHLRIPRGTRFSAGEPVGTLNAMNHVHLIAGRIGAEMNALDALILPGISDAISPVIENVEFYDENWAPIETKTPGGRIKLGGKTRIVVRAFDRMDGNPERRRLGVYRLGYSVTTSGAPVQTDTAENILFDIMPDTFAARFAYAARSRSGATGETIFNYIVTNRVKNGLVDEGFFDASDLPVGQYNLRILASDYFNNESYRDIEVEVIK